MKLRCKKNTFPTSLHMLGTNTDKEKKFLKVYEDLADPVFRHCYFRLSDREKAKDVVQETFKRFWEYLGKEKIENTKAFVFKIANNLIIDSYRKKKEESLDTLTEEGFDVRSDDHEAILNSVMGRELTSMLDQLSDTYRDLIVMRYIDDLPIYEIASVTGLNENVVSVRIHRGLALLRKNNTN